MLETKRRIIKSPTDFPLPPTLGNYDEVCAAFSWQQASRALDGLPEAQVPRPPRSAGLRLVRCPERHSDVDEGGHRTGLPARPARVDGRFLLN